MLEQWTVDFIANADAEQTVVMVGGQEKTQFIEKDEPTIYSPEDILKSGIEDISSMIRGEYSVTDVFRLCLEIMYRAIQFDHAVVCMINNKARVMEAKFGHGINNQFLKEFQFSMKYQPDVFHLGLEKGIDILEAQKVD